VAFTKCRYPAKKVQEEKEEESHEGGAPPEGTNVELLAHWMGLLEQYESKYVDPETMYCEWLIFLTCLVELLVQSDEVCIYDPVFLSSRRQHLKYGRVKDIVMDRSFVSLFSKTKDF